MLTLVFLASCSSNPVDVKPEPSGSSASSGSSSGTGGSGGGTQGAGGGISCDPCESSDGTRIVRRKNTTSSVDGMIDVQSSIYFDKLRNEPCFSVTAEDGLLRCLPSGGATSIGYADSSCAVPVGQFDACSPVPKTAIVFTFPTPGTCQKPYYAAYSVGAEHVGQLYAMQGMSCNPVSNPSYKKHLLTKLSASEFAELTVESKP